MKSAYKHVLWFPIALALSSPPLGGQQYIINTMPGTAGKVGSETRLAVDAAGNAYFTTGDTSYPSHTVLKVTPGGVASIFAGNGSTACSGDGGLATQAGLGEPVGFAFDGAGNLYIADRGGPGCVWGSVIRKVTPAGIISTPVNQLYTEACSQPYGCNGMYYASGVAVGGNGNLYIADSGHNWILQGAASGFGPVSYWPLPWVVAGERNLGTAGYYGDGGAAVGAFLNSPMGVAVDSAGNIYIADTENHRIRKVTAAGAISTVAGNGIADYSGDTGPATSASLNYPWDVAVDAFGNLYIADMGNRMIRKVTPAGIISTIAGNGGTCTNPGAGDGGPATQADLCWTWGVTVDPAGRIFIAAAGSTPGRIYVLRLPATTTTVTSISPEPSVLGQPYSVSFSVTPETGILAVGVNVTVTDGANTCTATVAQGYCMLPSSSVGAKSITATYPGDDHFSGSASTPVSHTVNKADSITTITSNLAASTVVGQNYSVTFTVVAKSPGSGAPSGNVMVSDGAQTCSATVSQASCLLTSVTSGTKTVTATYSGDANFNGSLSAGVSHPVTDAMPAAPSRVDAVVTANVNKKNTVYSGAVTWQDNSNNESGFRIRRFSNALGTCTVESTFAPTVGANVTSYTDATATATTCGYGVASYNANGNSAYVDDTNVVPGAAPSAPTSVNAVLIVSTKGKNQVNSVTVTWVNTAANVSNFLVRRYVTSGAGCAIDSSFATDVVPANKSSYTDSNPAALTCGYAVAASNSSGTSAWVGDQDLSTTIIQF
jgi:hypothetical protein